MTDKLREALERIIALDVPVNIVDVMDSTAREAVEIAKAALAQQDAQAGPTLADEALAEALADAGCSKGESAWQYMHPEDRRLWMAAAARAKELFQQDAQAASQPLDESLNAISKMFDHGEQVEADDGLAMLVPIDLWHDALDALEAMVGEDETDYAAPTPPAQRVMLTDEDIREWWVSENGLEDCDMTKLDDFTKVVRAVIEAYERKNGAETTPPAQQEDIAPWPDFLGQPIAHGARLTHPDGIEFVAIRLNGHKNEADAWRAVYDTDATVSRLCLQIGEKGRAVLVKQPSTPTKGEP